MFKLISSKGWSYFWIAFALLFLVMDILTGHLLAGTIMAFVLVFHIWDLSKKVNGTHSAYNTYYGKKV